MSKDIGKVDTRRLRDVFQRRAEHHQGLMTDSDKAGQPEVFQAHAAIASGYYRAAHLLDRVMRKTKA
jgi:hypothetical protein